MDILYYMRIGVSGFFVLSGFLLMLFAVMFVMLVIMRMNDRIKERKNGKK